MNASAGPRVIAAPHATLQAVALALIGLYLAAFSAANFNLQWDLRVYLAAAEAARAGGNPYDAADLAAAAGRTNLFPFVYPPVALLPFFALSAVGGAAALWLGLKLVLLAGLVVLWRTVFVPRTPVLIVALVAVFGWNGAALADLRAGNVATLETALVWAGLACFVHGRRTAFAALVVAAACFKLLPAAFLLLLLVPAGAAGPSPGRFAAAALALAALVIGPLWIGPAAAWDGFLAGIPPAADGGATNPGAASFLTALGARLGLAGPALARAVAAGFSAYAIGLVAASGPHLARAIRARDARGLAMAAAFLYVLLAPRPMAYGYMLLGAAPFIAAPRPFGGAAGRWVLMAILCVQGLLRAAGHPPSGLIAAHAPLLLTLMIWLLVLRQSGGAGAAAAPVRGGPPARGV